MSAGTVPVIPTVPPLRDGDRLSPDEFMRRYAATPEKFKAELLDGVVHVTSPVTRQHGTPHGSLMGWLVGYQAYTPGTDYADNTTTRLPSGSIPQPDVFLRIWETHGGQSHVDEDGYVAGVPELLGEIALSSLHRDRTVKLPIYERNGVREYILWRVEDREIEWHVLRGAAYELLRPGGDGIVRSETFPGLWLDVEAMLRGDMGTVLRVLQQGIASPEHDQFVQRLRQAPGA